MHFAKTYIFFFLLEFDKILTNSCISNYWEVNPPDQDIKISVSLSSVITVNIRNNKPSTGLFSSERAQSGTFIVPGQTSLLPSCCRKSCSQSSLLGRSNHAHCSDHAHLKSPSLSLQGSAPGLTTSHHIH